MKWTTPKHLAEQVERLWERGLILKSIFATETMFPRRLVLKGPSSSDLTHAFVEVREWGAELLSMKGLRIVSRTVNHRVSGLNEYPSEAWLDSADDAVRMLGKTKEWAQFGRLVDITRHRHPCLLAWIERHPLAALLHWNEWDRYLDLIDWLCANPRPGCYIRQVDLPGIDTKFIEGHRGVLSELFDVAIPRCSIESDWSGVGGFCRRYGFLDKPERIRVRVLDPGTDPLHQVRTADLTVDIETFAHLQITPRNLFITENETNFLSFPPLLDSWVLFGAGYGFSALKRATWLSQCRIVYWGDLDTHGFAALDEFRSLFPDTESILMDRATLIAHRDFWDMEPTPCTRPLPRLNEHETALYNDLRDNHFARNLRLEQERISFSRLLLALSSKGFGAPSQSSNGLTADNRGAQPCSTQRRT